MHEVGGERFNLFELPDEIQDRLLAIKCETCNKILTSHKQKDLHFVVCFNGTILFWH